MSTSRVTVLLGGALMLSLAANLFLSGAYAGRWSFHTPEGPQAGARFGMFMRFQTLPRDQRARFRETMQANAAQLRAAQLAVRSAQMDTLAVVRAPTYDKAHMVEAFAALRRATELRQQALHASLADAIATLPAESRESLAAGSRLPQP